MHILEYACTCYNYLTPEVPQIDMIPIDKTEKLRKKVDFENLFSPSYTKTKS